MKIEQLANLNKLAFDIEEQQAKVDFWVNFKVENCSQLRITPAVFLKVKESIVKILNEELELLKTTFDKV